MGKARKVKKRMRKNPSNKVKLRKLIAKNTNLLNEFIEAFKK